MNNLLTLKNNLPNLMVLQLHSQDAYGVQMALREKIKQAPMMFIGMQIIADISEFDREDPLSLDIKTLSRCLLDEGLNLIAVMSNRQSHRQAAVEQGVGAIPVVVGSERKKTMPQTATSKTPQQTDTQTQVASTQAKNATTQTQATPKKHESGEPRKTESDSQATVAMDNEVVAHPVRSGQRVYARGDLTVIGSVSPGAEVIADGNIHIYGALRGRAMAGAKGDESARIFCQSLDAELIAIAGNYKPNEEIDATFRQKSVQIALTGEKISFLAL